LLGDVIRAHAAVTLQLEDDFKIVLGHLTQHALRTGRRVNARPIGIGCRVHVRMGIRHAG